MNRIHLIVLLVACSTSLFVAGEDDHNQQSASIGEEYGIAPDWDYREDLTPKRQMLEKECTSESLEQLAQHWESVSITDPKPFSEALSKANEKVEMCTSLLSLGRNPEMKFYYNQIRPKVLAATSCSKVELLDPVPKISADMVVNGVVDYLISEGQVELKKYKKKPFRSSTGKRFKNLRRLSMDIVSKYSLTRDGWTFDKVGEQVLGLVENVHLAPAQEIREELVDYQIGSILRKYNELNHQLTISMLKPMSGDKLVTFDAFTKDLFREIERRAQDKPVDCKVGYSRLESQ